MKILVTAFDPFGGEAVNPAQLALKQLPETAGGADICKITVPTVFEKAGDEALSAFSALQPDGVVCLGQAGGRKAVTPERVAINVQDARIADNQGNQPEDKPIVPGGPAAYFSTLPIRAMVERIRALGLPAEISNTAGTFVCNDLMYRLLHHMSGQARCVPCGFIHVPYIPAQAEGKEGAPSMALADIVRALTAALEVLAEALAGA